MPGRYTAFDDAYEADRAGATVTRDPVSGILVLDETIDYADGAEDRLIEILRGVDDLSSLSDELGAHIDDWPTRYHLSKERSNLLRPLSIDHRHRVLEIGAGTGAISRYLGETGARVVALEGSLPRAQAAAVRCSDLDNVEVVCGALDAFEDSEGFDLVCLIGVLEYANVGALGTDPESFLRSAAAFLKPNGTLAVAIENQIGLKYLIGYNEDHLGRPWAGLEGYPDGEGVRTYSRQQLGELLENCGLASQHWFYPFPDYKLPSVVLADRVYDEERAEAFIDQVVRAPVGDYGDRPALLCDDQRVHRVMLEAGLGRDVANSFLVFASASSKSFKVGPDPEATAWLFGGQRRRQWIRHQVVETTATGKRIRADGPGDVSSRRSDAWLIQDPAKNDPFVVGTTIWEQAIDACRKGDIDALKQSLDLWRRTIDSERTTPPAHEEFNPFLRQDTREVLPPDYLDISLSNFVVSDNGVEFIDREWIAEPAVDADLVSVRGLWLLAQDLVHKGGIHPWNPNLTVAELAVELGVLADLPVEDHLEHLENAEAELLHLVTGRRQDSVLADLQWLDSFRPADSEMIRSMPMSQLRARLDSASAELANLDVERRERARLEEELAQERETTVGLGDELDAAHVRLADMGGKLEELGEIGAELEKTGADLKRANTEIAKSAKNAASLDKKLDIEGKQRARLERELKHERETSTRINSDLKAANARLAEMGDKLEELAELGARLDIEGRQRARLEGELKHERETASQIASDLKAANARLAEMGNKLEELAELGARLEKTGADLQRANHEIAEGAERAASLETELDEKDTALDQANTEIARGAETAAMLETEIAALKSRVADLETEMYERVRVAAELEAERNVLRKWRDDFERRLPVRAWRQIQRSAKPRH